MKTRFTNQPYHEEDYSPRDAYQPEERGVSRGSWFYPVVNFTLIDLLQRLFMGIKRLLVAIKYQFYKKTGASEAGSPGGPGRGKRTIPWFKIGMIGLVLFMFTQKDFQFSINMRAPKAVAGQEDVSKRPDEAVRQGMNIAQAISYKDNNRSSAASGKKATAISKSLNDSDVEAYIKRFRKVAVMEMKKFGIPASVKMAWGILESRAGQEVAAALDNNHFGALMEGQPYTTAWENWRAHSMLLRANYSGLFQSGSDYQRWVKALDQARVSADRDFDKNLLSLIERYQLDRLDQEFMQ
jgi:flagellum-specific peptidoglycan hydrolase FlgJ